MLGSEELSRTRSLTFGGPEGKPLYIAGPDDDAATVLRKLCERLGENGFNFITPEGDWKAVEEDKDRQPGLVSRVWRHATELLDSDLRTYKHL